MGLSKKYYIRIAEILNVSASKEEDIIINLANYFKEDNAVFNYERFFKVAGRVD